MAGRGSKELKPSPSCVVQEEKNTEIPSDLFELILSWLSLRDSIRASLVCKRWREIAISLRKKPMWLTLIPKSGDDSYKFYDPIECKSYQIKFPELRDSKVCYADHGWFLLYRHCDQLPFFFNPYTRGSIELPALELSGENEVVAFSAPPTSSDCIVFTASEVTSSSLAISTCRVGEATTTGWKTVNYQNGPHGYDFESRHRVVFCKGRFYCMDRFGWLGIYDPETLYWEVFRTYLMPENLTSYLQLCFWSFVAEYKGDVYVLFTHYYSMGNPVLYKLEMGRGPKTCAFYHGRRRLDLERVNEFEGMTFFAGSLGSFAIDVVEEKTMRNTVYFPKFPGRQCLMYSLHRGGYHPPDVSYNWWEREKNESRDDWWKWEKPDPYHSIWIESPKDVSVFLSDLN